MTNILSLPLITATVEISTNEDWRDNFAFVVAGSAGTYPAATNTGNGTTSAVTVGVAAPVGDSFITILAVVGGLTTFGLTDSDGTLIGIGTVGVPFNEAGFAFTLNQGSAPFVVGDALTIAVLGVPLDITGINLEMMVRQTPESATVALSASTQASTLLNGGTSGVIGLAVPQSTILQKAPEGAYVFDIIAVAGAIKRCVTGTLTVTTGVTVPS